MQHACYCYMQFLTECMQIVTSVTMAYYTHVTCNMQGFRTLFPHVACRFHAGFMQASVMPTCANGCLLHDCYVQEGCIGT